MMTVGVRAAGVHQVVATQAEKDAWHAKRCGSADPGHRCRNRPPYRVVCETCGTRMWLSGIGLGAHRRACSARQRAAWNAAVIEHNAAGPEHAKWCAGWRTHMPYTTVVNGNGAEIVVLRPDQVQAFVDQVTRQAEEER